MNPNGENLDSSLDSALYMSQDEIEKLINGQFQMDNEAPDYETADLESLLSELEAMEDDDIQEISDLLEKADNNEAVDQGIVDLLDMPEVSEEITAYDAMDLFSGEEITTKKEGFFKRLIAFFKKSPENKEEISDGEVATGEVVQNSEKETKKEKKKKEKKKKEKKKKEDVSAEVQGGQTETENAETIELTEDALNGSDAIILELEKEEVVKKEESIKEKSKKKEKNKKKKEKKKVNEGSADEQDDSSKKDKKKPKEKKVKEKKIKEKPIRLYDYDEVPLTGKKVSIVFFICIMFMLAVLALVVNFAGYRNRRLAEEAYEQEDYLQCYQLLYGQHLNEGQEVLYHKSKIHLKMDAVWNRYEQYMMTNQPVRGLDRLIQFVYEYPELSVYAQEWNCEEVTIATYDKVLTVLYDEYKLSEKDALVIANIADDVEYTKYLTKLVEKREKGMLKYPNMLPEEEERIEDSREMGGNDDSNY